MQPCEIPPQIMEPTFTPLEERLLTPPHGSTASAGISTMPEPQQNMLGQVLDRLQAAFAKRPHEIAVIPPHAPLKLAKKSSPPAVPPVQQLVKAKPLMNDPEGQDDLTRLLYQTYASQATYGDKAKMMEYRDQMFQLVLGKYTIAQVRNGFLEHLRHSRELPTPHCIARRIDPSLEPLSAAMVVRITQKIKDGSSWVSDDERAYIRRFEEQELKKVKQTA